MIKKKLGSNPSSYGSLEKAKTIYVHNNTSNDLEQRGGLGKW
jgi:hypothetical protein